MGFYRLSTYFDKFKSEVFNEIAPFITEASLKKSFAGFTVRHRIYHLWPLFQVFLHQVATTSSCSEAISWGVASGLLPLYTSPKTSSYCIARNRLPEQALRDTAFSVGKAVSGKARERDLLRGRRVKVADGSSVLLQDTASNQHEYPQSIQQKPGCGFPIMYICGLMDLASGAMLDAVVCGGQGHERTLFRQLWRSLEAGDILLGDRGLISYADFAMLLRYRVDMVMRQNLDNFRKMQRVRLGHGDWLVFWKHPKTLGKWVDPEKLPPMLIVRAVEFTIDKRDGGKEDAVLFTTLLDRKLYPRKKLVELYQRRWDMELNFRYIKTNMKLEMLKCKTPKRCRCEMWMGLLAYNIIRGVMLDAARKARILPKNISFTGTMYYLRCFEFDQHFNQDPQRAYYILLGKIAALQIGKRPGRREKRGLKRRQKAYPLLMKPRKTANEAVLRA